MQDRNASPGQINVFWAHISHRQRTIFLQGYIMRSGPDPSSLRILSVSNPDTPLTRLPLARARHDISPPPDVVATQPLPTPRMTLSHDSGGSADDKAKRIRGGCGGFCCCCCACCSNLSSVI